MRSWVAGCRGKIQCGYESAEIGLKLITYKNLVLKMMASKKVYMDYSC